MKGRGRQNSTSSPGAFKVGIPKSTFVPSIQGLRGLSAICVLIVHVWLIAVHASMLPWTFPDWLDATLPTLGQGVALFFIISGYLISSSLARHGNVVQFLKDRTLRIMPLYVLLHLLVFSLGPMIGYKEFRGMPIGEYVSTFLVNLLFLAPVTGHFLVQQNSWTLTYEWGFYLLSALAFFGLTRRRRVCWVLVSGAGALLAVFISPSVMFFVLGMMFAFVDFRLRLPVAAGWLIWSAALIAFFYASQYLGVALSLPLGAIVYGILLDGRSGPARLLSTTVFQYLGRISYSLYLTHPFVLFPFAFLAPKVAVQGIGIELWCLVYLLLGPIAVLVVSEISYRLVEVRLRRCCAKWLEGRRDPSSIRSLPAASGPETVA